MNKYQLGKGEQQRKQLKAQGNRRNQKNVNELLLVPKKEPGIFFEPLVSQIELLVKFNMKNCLKIF